MLGDPVGRTRPPRAAAKVVCVRNAPVIAL